VNRRVAEFARAVGRAAVGMAVEMLFPAAVAAAALLVCAVVYIATAWRP